MKCVCKIFLKNHLQQARDYRLQKSYPSALLEYDKHLKSKGIGKESKLEALRGFVFFCFGFGSDLMVYSGAAVCCKELKNYGKAVKYLERAQVVALKLYGKEHAVTTSISREVGALKNHSFVPPQTQKTQIHSEYDFLFKMILIGDSGSQLSCFYLSLLASFH